jgi:hypothetical protein
MNYNYRVITPFARFGNLLAFTRMLQGNGVIWHPVFNDDLPFGIHNLHWIDPTYAPPPPKDFCAPHWYINWFIEHTLIHDLDRYLFLMDDDFYEPGFFGKLDAVGGSVLICSMQRGQHEPPGSPHHGLTPLLAAKENLKICHVGAEQLIVSGSILRECRFGPGTTADGTLIESLALKHQITFVPHANVWFNYLEPGRWDH